MKTRILQILGVAAIATIGMTSCEVDACKDVDCGLYGECVDGDCVCDEGYTGVDCATQERATFVGNTVNLSGTVACGVSGNGTIPSTATTFSAGAGGVTKLVMNIGGSLAISCTVTSSTSFTVDSQTIDNYTYTGTGSLNGSVLNVTLNEQDPSVPETCVYTLTGAL